MNENDFNYQSVRRVKANAYSPMTSAKRNSWSTELSKEFWIAPRLILAYSIVAATCLMNLNGITAMAFGSNQMMSIAMLVPSLYILAIEKNFILQSLGKTGVLFIAFMFVFISIGFAQVQNSRLLVSFCNSIFLVAASAVGTRAIARRGSLDLHLLLLAVFSSLGALTIFLSPYLGGVYSRMWESDKTFSVGRWLGFFANPNSAGIACCYALIAVCATWFRLTRVPFVKFQALAILASIAFCCLLTFSRSAIVTFVLVSLVLVLINIRRNTTSVVLILAGFLFVCAAYWFFTSGYNSFEWSFEQRRRIQSIEKMITGETTSSRDFGGREQGISGGLDYWSESPIFGHGLGAFHRMPDIYFKGNGCHDTHIMVLGETGVFGFIPYLLFLIVFANSAFRVKLSGLKIFCLGVFCVFFLSGFASHGVLEDRNVCLMLGASFALISLDREASFYRMRVGMNSK